MSCTYRIPLIPPRRTNDLPMFLWLCASGRISVSNRLETRNGGVKKKTGRSGEASRRGIRAKGKETQPFARKS